MIMNAPPQKPTSHARRPQVLELSAVEMEREPASFDSTPDSSATRPTPPARKARWASLFLGALGGLALLGLSLWADGLIRDLFARQPLLGMVGLALLGLALLGFVGLVAREIRALMRLGTIDSLREGIARAHQAEDSAAARKLIDQLVSLYQGNPRTAHGRALFERHRRGMLDARDLILIAEESLLADLDRQAVALVSSASRRVSLVTALSPRALVDIAMVIFQCASLTRQIAQLYGARPGLLGGLALIRHMMAHLAITGGMAATEGLVSQVLGHSVAARLSTRLGEGVINGLLTARVGIAAISVMRPMPYLASNGPTLSDVTRGMAGFGTSLVTNEAGKSASSSAPAEDREP